MARATRTRRKICGGNLKGSIMPDFVFYFSERRGLPFPIADPATLVCKSRQFLFLQTADVGDQRLDFVARQRSIRPGDKPVFLALPSFPLLIRQPSSANPVSSYFFKPRT